LVRPRPGSRTGAAFAAALEPLARSPLTVHEQLRGRLQVLGQPIDRRPQMEPGATHPVGQGAAMDIDPRPGEDLALAMQWGVVGVLADQHMGDGALGGRSASSLNRWRTMPHPSIRAAGAGACLTPSVQARQAYLGRTVTSTR